MTPDPHPSPARRDGHGWMVALFLLGLIAGGGAVWWWSMGHPQSFRQVTETVRPPAVEEEPVNQPYVIALTLTPTTGIAPVAAPTPDRVVEKPLDQADVPSSMPLPTATKPVTPPPVTSTVPPASPAVIPTEAPEVAPTVVPTPAPTPSLPECPFASLSPIEVMRLVDQGKITPEGAVRILSDRKEGKCTPTTEHKSATPTTAATPTPTHRPTPPPVHRHYGEEKIFMLALINGEREKIGLAPVVLGDNAAAQKHAEELLRNNTRGHWGLNGMLPQMHYTLAGGVNRVAENVSNYRLVTGMPYQKRRPDALLKESHQGLMASPGHRKTILDKWHTQVSLGIACNDYACSLVQNFTGDYVEFDQKPVISKGTLRLAGWLKGGFQLSNIQVWYHEPPHPLTESQLNATYAYSSGQEPATILTPPPPPGSFYTSQTTPISWTEWTDPYKVDPEKPASAPAPRVRTKSVPYTIANIWSTSASNFQIRANLSGVINDLGPGVYMVIVWGNNQGEDLPLTNYAVFVDQE